MKLADMSQTEVSVFLSQLKLLEVEVTSTDELRQAIAEGRKALNEMKLQQEKEIQQKLAFLNEQEKILSNMEKGKYK
jgi:hypothetical protein